MTTLGYIVVASSNSIYVYAAGNSIYIPGITGLFLLQNASFYALLCSLKLIRSVTDHHRRHFVAAQSTVPLYPSVAPRGHQRVGRRRRERKYPRERDKERKLAMGHR